MAWRDDEIERIVLIGLSGSGKTTVARALADRLGWSVADSDDWIVAQTGRSIPDLFAGEGEAHFRRVEQEALRVLCARQQLVLATGGGVVTVEDNWPLLQARSRVVWLRARPETLVARLQAQAGEGAAAVRPLLAGADPLTRLQRMAAARAPFYARADVTVETEDQTPDEVADAVLTALAAAGVRLATVAQAKRGEP